MNLFLSNLSGEFKKIFKGIWSFNLEITGTLFFYSFSYHQNWLSITWRFGGFLKSVFQTALTKGLWVIFLGIVHIGTRGSFSNFSVSLVSFLVQ